MGLGITSVLAFPERVISQTTPYEELATLPEPDPGEVSRLYQEWLLAEKAKKFKGKYAGACVTFARKFTESSPDIVSGMAKNVPTNSQAPELGAIIKTNESKFGHLAVVLKIEGEQITLIESNYRFDGIVSEREISVNDPKILGYIIKPN